MKAALLALLALGACTGTTSDPGISALVRVNGAQFFEGAMPPPTTQVRVTSIDSLNNTVWAGQVGKGLGGRLEDAGRAVAIGFADDTGYWIVPAGAADINLPTELTWATKVSFSDELAAGTHELDVAAVDGAGAFGPPSTLGLTVRSRQLDLTGTTLAVSLRWDTESDLDLHLALPDGTIVWSGNLNSYIPPPPGEPVDPDAVMAGGILDFDSNSQCQIDGRREENIVWHAPAPAGHYAVLVDTFSLCAAPAAHWAVAVFVDGSDTPKAQAEGTAGDADTRSAHVASSGVRALDFDR